MRLSSIFVIAGTFLFAALLAIVAAGFSARYIEDSSRTEIRRALDLEDMRWAEVDANGLVVYLAGTAPTEAMRFKAITVAGGIVDATRVIDQMLVEDAAEIDPPRFSLEILSNEATISLIGLIPAATDHEAFVAKITNAAQGVEVADFMEHADYPVPVGWEAALGYAAAKMKLLPRAKVSIEAGRVSVTAMTDSAEEKRALEAELNRRVPEEVRVVMNISAPRPVITPFTLRFVKEDGAARFDACSADTDAARRTIIAAARKAGLSGNIDCPIGLGVPSPQWARAAELSIDAIDQLGGGSVTITDADVSLISMRGVQETVFDDVAGALENDLPEVFALYAVLPPPETDASASTPEFVATLSPEGLVQLRGRLDSEALRSTAESFAQARFSSGAVYMQARVVEGLPGDWPVRVLAGLEALSLLSNGVVRVEPETIGVSGNTGNKEASARISALLAEKLGETAQFEIDVTYRELLDPVAALPTPEECIDRINAIKGERKINFEPGSATLDEAGAGIMDDIAEVLKTCGEIRLEISGHTDSQGRETMNQRLSEERARSVLDALRARRVITSSFSSEGYGETQPIADNGTEEGREVNRRIEFRLIKPEPIAEEQTGLESLEEQGEDSGTADAAGDETDQDDH